MSIRRKLILLICVPLLGLYAAVLGWDYAQSREQAIEQAKQLVAERAGNSAAQINERLLAVQQAVDSAASALTNRQTVTDYQVRSAFMSMMRPNLWTEASWIAFAPNASRGPRVGAVPMMRRSMMPSLGGPGGGAAGGGAIGGERPERSDRANAGEGPGRGPQMTLPEMPMPAPLSSQPWFTAVQTTHKGTWFDPGTYAQPEGDVSAIYGSPFYNAEGDFAGVVCATVRVEDLQHLREDPSDSRRPRRREETQARPTTAPRAVTDGGYVLLDRERRMLSHPDSFTLHTPRPLPASQGEERFVELREAIAEASAGRGRVVATAGLDEFVTGFTPGEHYMLGLEPIRTTGWAFMTAVPQSQLLGPVQERLIRRAVVLVASVFALGIFVTWLITRFCRPIEKMAGRVEQIARGHLDIEPIPVRSNDEIGKLARGFNAMTRELRQHIDELTVASAARERVEGELRIARQIQTDLLPRTFPPFPERKEFDLHAINIPARHIAGDFFDFFFSADDVLTVVIADVSGKGVPAALMMAVTRTIIRNFAATGASPREIVERANHTLLRDTQPGLFVTMILGQYRPSTGDFTFVNAGHPYAVKFGNGVTPERACPPTAALIGVAEMGELGPIDEQTVHLKPGEGLLFYTDGITEARYQRGELYGEERLFKTVERFCGNRCADVCDGVVLDVMDYQHHVAADDVTMVSLHRLA